MSGRLKDEQRLEALHRSGLLEKPTPECMTHLCYTATELLKADVAQINVLDDRMQHHLAEWPRVAPRRAPFTVENAGCREVVLNKDVVQIANTLDHPILCQVPWAAFFQGYMGAPIMWDDQVIGSICVLTVQPRNWSKTDELALVTLAHLVEACIEEA